MLDVKFYDTIDDALLKFAVVISQRIFTIQSVLLRFRKVCYTPEFRFRGVFYSKLVDCLEKCLIYGHIRRVAD